MSQSGPLRVAETGGGSVVQTILGDTGSITGPIVTIFANQATNNSGATVKFVNSGTISTLNLTDGDLFQNTCLGLQAGGSDLSNSAANTCVGAYSGFALGSAGSYNTFIGKAAGATTISGIANCCFGFGASCGVSGSGNVIIGFDVGLNYNAAESNNIIINGGSIPGESNVIRIGIGSTGISTITSIQLGGIKGTPVSNPQIVAINSSTGQLGVVSGSPVVSTWTDVTSATQTLAVGNGYATDRGGGVTYTLPATATAGDVIQITGKSGIATITPNANQQIVMGSINGTVGVTGTCVALIAGSCIRLRCITGGTSSVYRAEEYPGGWTLT